MLGKEIFLHVRPEKFLHVKPEIFLHVRPDKSHPNGPHVSPEKVLLYFFFIRFFVKFWKSGLSNFRSQVWLYGMPSFE